jgi:hypothetical protein
MDLLEYEFVLKKGNMSFLENTKEAIIHSIKTFLDGFGFCQRLERHRGMKHTTVL